MTVQWFMKNARSFFSQKITIFSQKSENHSPQINLYKENISCRQKVRFRSENINISVSLMICCFAVKFRVFLCQNATVFVNFRYSLSFLGFKTWNFTVRWVVNGTILKGFDTMAPFFGVLLVFRSTLSVGDGGEYCFFGGAEAESSPEDHFRGDRTQKDEDFSRFLTLKPSIYIHDLSEIFRLDIISIWSCSFILYNQTIIK